MCENAILKVFYTEACQVTKCYQLIRAKCNVIKISIKQLQKSLLY